MSYLKLAKQVMAEMETDLPSPAELPLDWYVAWDERAAIMEYDGGLSRERAEALALEEVVAAMRRGDVCV